MARVGDLDGHNREGVYLNADGLRDLIRQLHGIVLLLDEMSGHEGHLAKSSATYGKDGRISGSGYLVDRNTSTLEATRKAVLGLAAKYRRMLDGSVGLINTHADADGDGAGGVRDAGN